MDCGGSDIVCGGSNLQFHYNFIEMGCEDSGKIGEYGGTGDVIYGFEIINFNVRYLQGNSPFMDRQIYGF